MKLKRVSIVLVLLVFSLCAFGNNANARDKYKLTVKYKGKTVSLCQETTSKKYTHDCDTDYAKVKKVWGKATKSKKYVSKYTKKKLYDYDYIAGESAVNVGHYDEDKKNWTFVQVSICDENMIANGVKIGTTKEKAMKILKKRFGKKNVKYKEGVIKVADKKWYWGDYSIEDGKVDSFYYVHY